MKLVKGNDGHNPLNLFPGAPSEVIKLFLAKPNAESAVSLCGFPFFPLSPAPSFTFQTLWEVTNFLLIGRGIKMFTATALAYFPFMCICSHVAGAGLHPPGLWDRIHTRTPLSHHYFLLQWHADIFLKGDGGFSFDRHKSDLCLPSSVEH